MNGIELPQYHHGLLSDAGNLTMHQFLVSSRSLNVIYAFRSCNQKTRTRTGKAVRPHCENCWLHRRAPALCHHLPWSHPSDEETVRTGLSQLKLDLILLSTRKLSFYYYYFFYIKPLKKKNTHLWT